MIEYGPARIYEVPAARPAELARLIRNVTRRISDAEWSRAHLCTLLEAACADESEFRRMAKEVGTSHRSLHRWASVDRYFQGEETSRQRTETETFRTHVKWMRQDGAL